MLINSLLQKKKHPKHKNLNACLLSLSVFVFVIPPSNYHLVYTVYLFSLLKWIGRHVFHIPLNVFYRWQKNTSSEWPLAKCPLFRSCKCAAVKIHKEKTTCFIMSIIFYFWILRYNYNNYVLDFLCFFFSLHSLVIVLPDLVFIIIALKLNVVAVCLRVWIISFYSIFSTLNLCFYLLFIPPSER